ncbi:MAG: peptidase U32 [Deltaproteobacteria bacterium]|nr:peptidase U32 [Deltaproteobacteria bacterium]
MKLCAPTNFDDALIAPLAQAGVYEIYGKLTADAVGGGRTSHILPDVGFKRLESHASEAAKAGIRFNYLLNAAAMGGMETTARGYRAIRRLLDRLARIGITLVTVTNPVLLQLIKRHYPSFKVKVSAFSNVVSPLQARFWEEMGADVITVCPVMVNREFAILAEIGASVKAELQVIANNNCLQSCPFYSTHANLVSHTSQKGHWSRGYMIDYCLVNCRRLRLLDPGYYLRGDWIRPEDVHLYEAVGIEHIKLVNRSNPTDVIIARVKAYAARKHDGNLLELVEHARDFRTEGEQTVSARARMARTFVRPLLANPLRMKELSNLVLPHEPVVEIVNADLDGFIDYFRRHSCMGRDCRRCGYCDEWARKVVRVDGRPIEEYRRRYQESLDKYLDGYFFHYR